MCGYDSASMTYFGQKIFVYAAGLEASRCLVKTIKTVESFIDMAQSGAPNGWQSKFSVCLPETKSLVVQPSLFAHSVLTVSGPSLVVGWEPGKHFDVGRLSSSFLRLLASLLLAPRLLAPVFWFLCLLAQR